MGMIEGTPVSVTDVFAGESAPQLMTKLPRLLTPSVASFTLTTYLPLQGVEERLQDEPPGRTQEPSGMPKESPAEWWRPWKVIVDEVDRSRQFEILVDKLLQHDTERELRSRFEVPARELATGNVLRRLENVPAGSVLAICSRCQLVDGSWGHIPMMDFHCPPTAHRLEFVRTALVR